MTNNCWSGCTNPYNLDIYYKWYCSVSLDMFSGFSDVRWQIQLIMNSLYYFMRKKQQHECDGRFWNNIQRWLILVSNMTTFSPHHISIIK